MALSADTNATFPHVLSCDAKEPRSRQRRFFLKNLSRRDYDAYAQLARRGDADEPAPGELRERLLAAVALILASWRGVEDMDGNAMPFAPGRIAEALTIAEMWEIYFAGIARLEVEDDERKNSGSPSPSAAAASAEGAGAPVTVKIDPVTRSQ